MGGGDNGPFAQLIPAHPEFRVSSSQSGVRISREESKVGGTLGAGVQGQAADSHYVWRCGLGWLFQTLLPRPIKTRRANTDSRQGMPLKYTTLNRQTVLA